MLLDETVNSPGHDLLQELTPADLQRRQICRREGLAPPGGIRTETGVREMVEPFAGDQLLHPTALGQGLVHPAPASIAVVTKGQFTVVVTGGGAHPEHIALQRDALQGNVFPHIPVDQIGDGVGNPELAHPLRG